MPLKIFPANQFRILLIVTVPSRVPDRTVQKLTLVSITYSL